MLPWKDLLSDEEMEAVVKSIKGYLDSVANFPIEEQPTIAVLVPRNARGVEVVKGGQRGVLGRYPIHFHHSLDMENKAIVVQKAAPIGRTGIQG